MQGLKTHYMSFSAFLFIHILQWICLKILLSTESVWVTISFLNWSYTRLIIVQTWHVRISNKNVSKNLCHKNPHQWLLHYSAVPFSNRVHILYQINQIALKLGYNFTHYGKFADNCWIEELQNRKPISPILASSEICRKEQAMGFEPLCHNCTSILYFRLIYG